MLDVVPFRKSIDWTGNKQCRSNLPVMGATRTREGGDL